MTYEQFMCALCVFREARDQPLEAKRGVYRTILNRATDARHRWSASIPGVILQPRQFSSFNPGNPNATVFPLPSKPADWVAWQACLIAVGDSTVPDPTAGATHYYSGDEVPDWADSTRLTCTIGAFKFFKL